MGSLGIELELQARFSFFGIFSFFFLTKYLVIIQLWLSGICRIVVDGHV